MIEQLRSEVLQIIDRLTARLSRLLTRIGSLNQEAWDLNFITPENRKEADRFLRAAWQASAKSSKRSEQPHVCETRRCLAVS